VTRTDYNTDPGLFEFFLFGWYEDLTTTWFHLLHALSRVGMPLFLLESLLLQAQIFGHSEGSEPNELRIFNKIYLGLHRNHILVLVSDSGFGSTHTQNLLLNLSTHVTSCQDSLSDQY
jgi:hypothetical protein